ncbi:MAG TPA: hypothetical protein VNN72_30140 [Polyangiaceae bacterium]|nr:hypothetical protein [Polyangiaceae bacterium]
MTISINGSLRVLGALSGLGLVGCGALPEGPTESGDTLGTASIALTQVPSPVQCIRVVTSGSSVVTTNLTVAVGSSSASLNLGRLPLGPTQFSATAYDLPCSGVGTALPSWVSDTVSTTLRAGVPATVALTFRTDNSVTVNANFIQSALEIQPHRFSGLGNGLVMADGTIRATGFTWSMGAFQSYSIPAMAGLTDIQTGASGQQHDCFIKKTDGSVVCTGSNEFGQIGPNFPVGAGQTSFSLVAVPFPGNFGRAAKLIAGRDFTCAVSEPSVSNSTDIYCWGNNTRGQLGASTSPATFSATPVRVLLGGNEGLSAGDQFACTVSFGTARCWGANSFGQLGDGTTTDRTTPVGVGGNFAAVSMGLGANHACAVTAAGGLKCWGNNNNGQLGDGTTTQATQPVDVVGLGAGSNVVQVAGGTGSTFARFANGSVSVWGQSFNGESGLGDRLSRNTPTPLTSIQDVAQIASSGDTTIALLSDRTVLAWGDNGNFTIGDGTRNTRYTPVKTLSQ